MQKFDSFDLYDNNGERYFVDINREGNYIHLDAHDDNKNNLAYLDSFVGCDKVYLDVIFCEPKYRNRGIASKLLDMLSVITNGSMIYGAFRPWAISSTKEETDRIAKSFYEKNGYKIVTLNNYLNHMEDYPSIQETDFCVSNRSNRRAIVYKKEKVKNKIKIFK